MKIVAAICLFFSFAFCVAQNGVRINFGSAGNHAVWTAPDLSESADEATEVQEKTYDFTGVLSDYLLVLDRATGNVAFKKVRQITGDWNLAVPDFKLIGYMNVRVEHEGKPVKVASIRVNHSVPKVIDEDSKGVAQFTNVVPGSVKVEVSFRSNKKERVVSQSFDLSLKRDDAIPTIIVSIPQEVETLAGTDPKPTSTGETKGGIPDKPSTPEKTSEPKAPKTNFLQQIIFFLISAALLAGLLYFALKWVLGNEDTAKGALAKIGVTVQDPDPVADPNAAPPAPPAPATPEPISPIILGADAVVTAPTTTSVPITQAASLSGEPRLVRSNGSAMDIPQGVSAVGREDGLPFSFAGESTISRRHAEIVRNGSTIVVRDLGSTNGTFVNGQKVTGEMSVNHGDTVQFGAVQLRLE